MKIINIILVLCVPIWVHAQSWLSSESTVLENNNFAVDTYAQKIKAIDAMDTTSIYKQYKVFAKS